MNTRALTIVVISVGLLASACNKASNSSTSSNSTSTATATPDEFAATRTIFTKNCKSCHGDKGEGGPVKLEDGTRLKVPTFREGHALRHPDSEFVKQITKGGDGMPAFGEKLTTPQINDMVRLIRHDFQPGVTPPAEPAKK